MFFRTYQYLSILIQYFPFVIIFQVSIDLKKIYFKYIYIQEIYFKKKIFSKVWESKYRVNIFNFEVIEMSDGTMGLGGLRLLAQKHMERIDRKRWEKNIVENGENVVVSVSEH